MNVKNTEIGPIAQKKEHLRTHHGITENDPWYWLDTQPNDENHQTVQNLVALENKWAEKTIEHTRPLREKLVTEIRELTQETDATAPVKYGDHWYYTRTYEGIDYPSLCRVKSTELPKVAPHAPLPNEEIILNQAQRAAGTEFYSAANQLIDVTGNRFIWGEDTTGGELYDLHIMDLETGKIIDSSVKQVGYSLAITGNDLYYVRVDESWRAHQIWVHEIGTDPANDALVLTEPDEKFELYVSKSRDKNWILISAYATLSTRIWMLPADGKRRQPKPVTPPKTGLRYSVEPAGDHLLINHNLLTEDTTLAIVPTPTLEKFEGTSPAETLCPTETWIENWTLKPGERLLEVYAFQKFTAFAMRANGQTQIRIWPRTNTTLEKDVPASETKIRELYEGSIDVPWEQAVRVIEPTTNPDWETTSFRFTVQSLAQPPITAEYDVTLSANKGTSIIETTKNTSESITTYDEKNDYEKIRVIKELHVPGFNPNDYETQLQWVTARDGVKIPVSMVYRKGITPNSGNPGLIYGYGSYEVSIDPWFSINRLTMLNRGVVYAIAHIRGGGEMGRNWYEQGKFKVKTNTFNDFVDVSKWLIESGWVAEGRLAAQGGSAGGLLMGAVANQAPALYRVIDAHVPFVDALTTILDPSKPLTTGEWDEWGNPLEDPEIYQVMRGYSPYENVQATTYPTMIAQTSLNDIRVSYVEPLKWVQRLRDVTAVTSENPVICLIEEVAGHAGGSGRSKQWDEFARSTAFMLNALGVTE